VFVSIPFPINPISPIVVLHQTSKEHISTLNQHLLDLRDFEYNHLRIVQKGCTSVNHILHSGATYLIDNAP
jgi:hypothetical protein